MRLLFITVRSDFGGGPRHVNQLIELLPSTCSVYMAYPSRGEPYGKSWENNKRIKDTCFIPFRRFSLKALFELRRFVIRNNIHIVHSHGNGAGIYSRLLKIIYPQIKVIHTFHGISDNYSSNIKGLMSHFIGRILSPFADKYIAVSYGEKQLAIKRKFSKVTNIQVIYNGIEDIGGEAKLEMHYPIRIVTLSRFDYQKNMESLYRIALHCRDLPIKFIWIGDGKDKQYLELLSKQNNANIEFVGFSNVPMKYLKKSDWYMSTSRSEGLPYALIEAASVGLPIIASNVKGNNEVTIDGYNGFLFRTEEQAIEILERLVNKSVDYEKLSTNSIELFKKHFSDVKMINELQKLYKQFNLD